MKNSVNAKSVILRKAGVSDLEELVAIENAGFDYDRLSKRSLRHWIKSEAGILIVAADNQRILGYGLVWCHKGTRLSRLYSVVVAKEARGMGLAKQILESLEKEAVSRGYLFMRLEVSKSNSAAIALYQKLGYGVFGEYFDYYDDHSDALRMQKTIRHIGEEKILRLTPWYQQTTNFTCGPAALMMAMASLNEQLVPEQSLELQIWREATTIFMTSGHGGCHPLGLALAANRRGFGAEVFINSRQPLFVDGVRSKEKKMILKRVHNDFLNETMHCDGVRIHYQEIKSQQIAKKIKQGCAVLVLISTYRLDNKKAPHWVTITNVDDHCFYLHDPDAECLNQQAIDCQYMPIAREDFEKMTSFGSGRLKAAIVINVNKS